MHGIAKLLFGEETGRLAELLASGGDGGDGSDLAERARRAGEWCGSTPGRGPGGPIAEVLRGALSR